MCMPDPTVNIFIRYFPHRDYAVTQQILLVPIQFTSHHQTLYLHLRVFSPLLYISISDFCVPLFLQHCIILFKIPHGVNLCHGRIVLYLHCIYERFYFMHSIASTFFSLHARLQSHSITFRSSIFCFYFHFKLLYFSTRRIREQMHKKVKLGTHFFTVFFILRKFATWIGHAEQSTHCGLWHSLSKLY